MCNLLLLVTNPDNERGTQLPLSRHITTSVAGEGWIREARSRYEETDCLVWSLGPVTWSVVCWPAGSISPGDVLEFTISSPAPDPMNQSLHVNKIPKRRVCTSESEKCWCLQKVLFCVRTSLRFWRGPTWHAYPGRPQSGFPLRAPDCEAAKGGDSCTVPSPSSLAHAPLPHSGSHPLWSVQILLLSPQDLPDI